MKDETFGAYKAFTAWAKSQHGTQIKQLCSDRGGKFTGHDFTNLLLRAEDCATSHNAQHATA